MSESEQPSESFASFENVTREIWPWPNFSPAELACKGSGRLVIAPAFMDRLQRLRDAFGEPLRVSSGYRSPAYNARVSSTGADGPHTSGRAVDIAIAGADAFWLLGLALEHGFTGIGVRQSGPWDGRFLHLDDLEEAPGRPRPRLWSY